MICIGTVSSPVSHRCKKMMIKAKNVLEDAGVKNGSNIAVAFSGGCDSSALLHIIRTFAVKENYNLCAIHINHSLRGAESDADEQFAVDVCKKYGVQLFTYRVDVIKQSKATGESTELCARRLRYEIFDKYINEGWYVATAHTASDNAETVLFNLTRGTGVKGLSGIPEVRDKYIRPLIYCTRDEIEKYCLDNGVEFVVDSSNLTDDYTRNYIRHNVVPSLKQINPSFERAVAEMSTQMSCLDAMLDRMANIALNECKREDGYCREGLIALERPVCERAVRIAAKIATGRALDSKQTKAVLDILFNGGRLQLFNGWYVSCSKALRFYKSKAKCDVQIDVVDGMIEFNGYFLRIETKTNFVNSLLTHNAIDYDKISNRLVIRTRLKGETVKINNRPTKQVRRILNEIKVPDAHRDVYPIISDDDGAVYIPNVGVAQRVVPDSNTNKVIIITFEGENNA